MARYVDHQLVVDRMAACSGETEAEAEAAVLRNMARECRDLAPGYPLEQVRVNELALAHLLEALALIVEPTTDPAHRLDRVGYLVETAVSHLLIVRR